MRVLSRRRIRRVPRKPALRQPRDARLRSGSHGATRASAAEACPAGAISVLPIAGARRGPVDLGRCISAASAPRIPAVGISAGKFELADHVARGAGADGRVSLNADGTQRPSCRRCGAEAGRKLRDEIHRVLGRSLAIREVDAGSCNGCELEIIALNNPVYDIERFGIQFVASPRHADMLLVTGPVTRNMELALRKTYEATPEPKLVMAVGACGIQRRHVRNVITRRAAEWTRCSPSMFTSLDARRAPKRCCTESYWQSVAWTRTELTIQYDIPTVLSFISHESSGFSLTRSARPDFQNPM